MINLLDLARIIRLSLLDPGTAESHRLPWMLDHRVIVILQPIPQGTFITWWSRPQR